MSHIYQAAKEYIEAGFSVLGCREDKKPIGDVWASYQSRRMTADELEYTFVTRGAPAVAIIAGAVSDGLEVIDIDIRGNDKLLDEVWNEIIDFFGKTPVYAVKTPKGGMHIYYRTDTPLGNKKLAKREKVWIIETRGEGGYVLAPPSANYEIVAGSFLEIPRITDEDRDALWTLMQSFTIVDEDDAKQTERVYPTGAQGSSNIYKVTPWDAYNAVDDFKAILLEAGWEMVFTRPDREFWRRPGSENQYSANFHTDKRVFWTFSDNNTPLTADKPLSPFDVYLAYKHGGDVSKAIGALRMAGYGKVFDDKELEVIQEANMKFAEGYSDPDVAKLVEAAMISRSMRVDPREIETYVAAAKKEAILPFPRFWKQTKTGYKFKHRKFSSFLEHVGFRSFVQEPLSLAYRLVRMDPKTRVVAEYALDMAKKYVIDYLQSVRTTGVNANLDDIMELLAELPDADWKRAFDLLPRVGTYNTAFLKDDAKTAFFVFRNAIIRITADHGPEQIGYGDIPDNTFVWASNIINDDIQLAEFNNDVDLNRSIFHQYIKRISGIKKEHDALTLEEIATQLPAEYELFSAFVSTVGYLLHTYKDPTVPYAIIFCEDTANDGEGGGTGKSLLYKCIKLMRCVDKLSGQEWSPDSAFPYQTVRLGSNVLVYDDLPKYFKVNKIYNVVTEGITLEKKFRDTLSLEYKDSPKVVLVTNYDILLDGNHAKRRFRKVPFVPYFGDHHTPRDEFGQGMGEEFTEEQRQLFYNTAFMYLASFLQKGLVEVGEFSLNMKIKAVKEAAGAEFYDWFSEAHTQLFNEPVSRVDLYTSFVEEYADKRYTMRRFIRGMEFYCQEFGLEIEITRNWSSTNYGKQLIRLRKIDEEGLTRSEQGSIL